MITKFTTPTPVRGKEQDFTNLEPVYMKPDDTSTPIPIPIVAGNVSLYNESKSGAIPASPMISAVGSLHKDQVITSDFSEPNQVVILIGDRQINLGGSLWYEVNKLEDINLPKFDLVKIRQINKAVLSVHCHNDLGLAVANSLAGVSAGARQVECTINGIGERAGNASLEEIVMAIKTRNDLMPYETGINTTLIRW